MTVDERLARLERSVSRWRVATITVAALAAGGLLLAAGEQVPDVVAAREFRLVNAKGEVSAVLGSEDGKPRLGLLREDGRFAVRLQVLKGGEAMLNLLPEHGKGGVMAATNDAGSDVTVQDSASRAAARIIVADKAGTISTLDVDGKQTWH